MKNKEVGVSIGATVICFVMFIVMISIINSEKEVERQLDELRKQVRESKSTSPYEERFDAPIAQINHLPPDKDTGLNRFEIRAYKMMPNNVMAPLIGGVIQVMTQKMETDKKSQWIEVCAFEIDIKSKKISIYNQTRDCIEKVEHGVQAGSYVVTEKSKIQSAAVASVSLHAEWEHIKEDMR